MIFFEILLSATIISSAIYGLFLGGCMKNPGHSHNMLSYYTNLSNLAILVYQMLVLVSFAFPKSGFYSAVRNPVLQYSVANAITMTFLVYHFILFPAIKRKREAMTDAEKKRRGHNPKQSLRSLYCAAFVFFVLVFVRKQKSFFLRSVRVASCSGGILHLYTCKSRPRNKYLRKRHSVSLLFY